LSDIDGVNSFWIQARAEWDSERAALQEEIRILKIIDESNQRGLRELAAELRDVRQGNALNRELEETHELLNKFRQDLRKTTAEKEQIETAWKAQANETAILKAAITQMLTYLSGDNFRSQQMSHARSVGEKALKGRYSV